MLKTLFYKLKAMTGNIPILFLMFFCCTLCFLCVFSILNTSSDSQIKVACIDSDNSQTSKDLINSLIEKGGIELIICDNKKSEKLFQRGKVESLFFIDKGFEASFLNGVSLPIRFIAGSSGFSSTVAKEIIGGTILSMQSEQDALIRLQNDFYNIDQVKQTYNIFLESVDNQSPQILTVIESNPISIVDKPIFGQIFARYSGFVSLVILMFLLSLSVMLSSEASKNISKAIRCVKFGLLKACLSDFFAFVLVGVIISIIALFIKGNFSTIEFVSYFFYNCCIAGICINLSLFRPFGGIDMCAPIIALITGIIGGCFFDFSSFGKFFRIISLFSPQGLLSSSINGNFLSLTIMITFSFLLLSLKLFYDYKR